MGVSAADKTQRNRVLHTKCTATQPPHDEGQETAPTKETERWAYLFPGKPTEFVCSICRVQTWQTRFLNEPDLSMGLSPDALKSM